MAPTEYKYGVRAIVLNPTTGTVLTGQVAGGKTESGPNGHWAFCGDSINTGEDAKAACYRALYEKLGLPADVFVYIQRLPRVVGYNFPRAIREAPGIGQEYKGEKWSFFILSWNGPLSSCDLTGHLDRDDSAGSSPDFGAVAWKDWQEVIDQIPGYQRPVYKEAKKMAEPLLAASASKLPYLKTLAPKPQRGSLMPPPATAPPKAPPLGTVADPPLVPQQLVPAGQPDAADNVARARDVPFASVVAMWEQAAGLSKMKDKQDLLARWWSYWGPDNKYPVLRLMLPQLDKERQTYGMKESVLAKTLIAIYNIEIDKDVKRLTHWRKAHGGDSGVAGEFALVAQDVLKNRAASEEAVAAKGIALSVHDVNVALDALNTALSREAKVEALATGFRYRATARDMQWICRIILKDLNISMSEKTVLNSFHPDAVEYHSTCMSLRRVAIDLADPSVRTKKQSVRLMHALRPMLCARKPIADIVGYVKAAERECVYERKFDGERLQIHLDRDAPEGSPTVRLLSRNAKDYTALYMPMMGPLIEQAVRPSVRSAVLDGELCGWDTISQTFTAFGNVKTIAARAAGLEQPVLRDDSEMSRRIKGGEPIVGKYMVWDILILNGTILTEKPLKARHRFLLDAISPIPERFEIPTQTVFTSTDQLQAATEAAVMNNEEGLIVKAMDDPYVPDSRKFWVKVKPEYHDGGSDDMDLLIVGGYYGKGKRKGGTVSHFLLGVLAPKTSPDEPDTYFSFSKVGSGYSEAELRALQDALAPHWNPYHRSDPPKHLILAEPFKERPDVWIEPEESAVLQVRATEIIPSDKFQTRFTLRFPRVWKARTDKGPEDAMDFQDAVRLKETGLKRKGAHSTMGDSDDEFGGSDRGGKRRRVYSSGADRGARSVAPQYQATDVSGVTLESAVFAGAEFCVLAGHPSDPTASKAALETLIHEHGGKFVQNPTPRTTAVIAGTERHVRVSNLITAGTWDIVTPEWVKESVAARKPLPYRYRHMIHITDDTRDRFDLLADDLGDPYFQERTVADLRAVFQAIPQESLNVLSRADVAQLERRYFPESVWGIFRAVVAYVDRYAVIGDATTLIPDCALDATAEMIEVYGGVVSPVLDETVTHVVLDAGDLSRRGALVDAASQLLDYKSASGVGGLKHFVRKAWVDDTVAAKEFRHEDPYKVRMVEK